ncbi:hypothetical protein GCM10010404_31910 [Nonomuraea africana]|uniref:Uncharacterized protein n=1 Tax=Nonomuraea africana TaxID=46171 RepID=A0ABR9KQ70_9ACTN|nr:hypothetical protein [Nonomuraea africana]MBE1564169.1 hypothetical protein [Nonomuraea africana]
MVRNLFTAGVIVASAFVAPVTMTATPLLAPASAATSSPTSTAEKADWHRGPTFGSRSACRSYGEDQRWNRWECRQHNGSWTYWYWN